MPIYIKQIRGNFYYYEQYSVYQGPGLPPKTPSRYIGPVNPKRRKGTIAGFIEANFKYEPGEVAAERAARDYPAVASGTKPAPKLASPADKPAPAVSIGTPAVEPSEADTLAEDAPAAAPDPDCSEPQ